MAIMDVIQKQLSETESVPMSDSDVKYVAKHIVHELSKDRGYGDAYVILKNLYDIMHEAKHALGDNSLYEAKKENRPIVYSLGDG